MSHGQVQTTLDHLFRRESGRIVAYLTRFLGPDHLDLAENVVQDALVKAVQTWPIQGIPDNPAAWILQVSKNSAIDSIRSGKFVFHDSELVDSIQSSMTDSCADLEFENEIRDDQLKLMFICCHPVLPREARIALTLKTVCGFNVAEIAKAFLSKEETIAQRIVRAKKTIAENNFKFEVPMPNELELRLQSVLEVIYLLFNEGYSATEGSSLIRHDLCEEAIHRTQVLSEHPVCQRPQIFALLALMHFQVSRFNSRLDADGELLLLEEQDRKLWDQEHIGLGMKYLGLSADGEELSDYHLQAGIASCHAAAKSFAETDWERILTYYDLLLMKDHSPIVALNRAVAIAMIHGPAAGLNEVDLIKALPPLKSYYLLPATMAELNRRLGNMANAKTLYEQSLELVGTEPERRLILKRIKACETNH
ncbi:MAG: RNA polymerase sigma factor [Pseudobdellovibrionaceae bacterium]